MPPPGEPLSEGWGDPPPPLSLPLGLGDPDGDPDMLGVLVGVPSPGDGLPDCGDGLPDCGGGLPDCGDPLPDELVLGWSCGDWGGAL